MPRRLLVAVLVVVCAVPAAAAGKRALIKACKANCGSKIQECIDQGGKRMKCKRKTIRFCKREGILYCVPPGTYAVAPSGADGSGCGMPDAPCRSIQYVIDHYVPAGGAGSIKAATGTYDALQSCLEGSVPSQTILCVANKQVTVRGGFVPPNWDTPSTDPSLTVLDAKGAGRGARIGRTGATAPLSTLDLQGVTIRNGVAQGIASADINERSAFGGGMLVEASSVTLRNVVFESNQSIAAATNQAAGGRASGGGLAANGISWATAVVTLEQVTFTGNQATGASGADAGGYAVGGAVFTYLTNLTGDGIVLTDNTATAGPSNGGGVTNGEKSDALGGAVAVMEDSTVDLRHVQARGNLAVGGAAPNGEAGGAFGGAFYSELGTLTLTDAVIEQNRAQGGDGTNNTQTCSVAQGGGVQSTTSTVSLDRVVLLGNEARSGNGAVNGGAAEGGGLTAILGMRNGVMLPVTVLNAVIADNFVSVGSGALNPGGGGGVWVQGATATLQHTTIANNRLGSTQMFHHFGGGIGMLYVPGLQTGVTVVDSILANHSTPGMAPQAYADAALWAPENTNIVLTRILFANNTHDTNAGVANGFNLQPGNFTQTSVTTVADARFVSPGSPDNDYHLTAISPAIDGAVGSTVAVDLEGATRPYGAVSDLGAYEYRP